MYATHPYFPPSLISSHSMYYPFQRNLEKDGEIRKKVGSGLKKGGYWTTLATASTAVGTDTKGKCVCVCVSMCVVHNSPMMCDVSCGCAGVVNCCWRLNVNFYKKKSIFSVYRVIEGYLYKITIG